MNYQDAWSNGKTIAKGYRECAKRYEIVKAFCTRYDRPFTVCDIGANMCYFGLRLTEDFPQCHVMAFEFHPSVLHAARVQTDKAERLLLFGRKLSIGDLYTLGSFCHFDVVLALSVIQHLPGSFDEWMKAIRSLGNNLIAEFAGEDSPRVDIRKGYRIPADAITLGYGESHKQRGFRRPIVLISSEENA